MMHDDVSSHEKAWIYNEQTAFTQQMTSLFICLNA